MSNKGKTFPKEWRENISKALSGEKNPNFNKPRSEITREKIRSALTGKKKPQCALNGKRNPCFGKFGEKSPAWKGGRVLSQSRFHGKRGKTILNAIPLNKSFEGSVGHHINSQQIIFIQEEKHSSIRHGLSSDRNMDKINSVAIEEFVKREGLL